MPFADSYRQIKTARKLETPKEQGKSLGGVTPSYWEKDPKNDNPAAALVSSSFKPLSYCNNDPRPNAKCFVSKTWVHVNKDPASVEAKMRFPEQP